MLAQGGGKPYSIHSVHHHIQYENVELCAILEKKGELFEEFSGSVERMINEKEERLGALREKYESAD